jgi:hypothetical protein
MSDQPEDDDRTIIRPPPKPAPAPDIGNALPVGYSLGEFEITGMVGEGGFGIVYLAWDHSLERKVALKEYMPSALAARTGGTQVSVKSERHRDTFEAGRKSFVNEAKLLAQFDHPSLVKVYRFWEANGTAYMVMPFYEGVTLKDTLAERKRNGQPVDELWLLELLDPLTEALAVIHNEQCFHRDIAPDNVILLKGSNRPLLLDFGAARRVIGDMTQALTVILKPGYAPVEQYAEVPGMKQGAWTDVYALAASVYYAITGKTPPPSVARLMTDSYVSLAQAGGGKFSERFVHAIDRALVVKPEERTQNIAELRRDLGLEADAGAPAPRKPKPAASAPAPAAKAASAPAPRAAAPAAEAKKPLALWAGLGVGALLLAGGGAWFALKPTPAPAPVATASTPAPAPEPAATPAPAPAATPAPPDATALPPAPPDNTAPPAPAPAPATTAATHVPTAGQPLNAVQEFNNVVAAQTPGWTVTAAPAKPAFRIGRDRLGFSVSSARDGYVYVLLKGTDGSFMRLFPNAMAGNNRIRAGETLKLPTSAWPMDVSGPKGTDHFLVIVSASKRDFTVAGLQVEGGFGDFPDDAAQKAVDGFSGPGSVFSGKPTCSSQPCPGDYGAATFTSEEIDG